MTTKFNLVHMNDLSIERGDEGNIIISDKCEEVGILRNELKWVIKALTKFDEKNDELRKKGELK